MAYLEKATNFQDIPVKKKPEDGYPAGAEYLCPVCKGHGKWNLLLDRYGEGEHLQGFCVQCWGWGWVDKQSAECVHQYRELSQAQCREEGITHFGNCWHVERCAECGNIISYDSSG